MNTLINNIMSLLEKFFIDCQIILKKKTTSFYINANLIFFIFFLLIMVYFRYITNIILSYFFCKK